MHKETGFALQRDLILQFPTIFQQNEKAKSIRGREKWKERNRQREKERGWEEGPRGRGRERERRGRKRTSIWIAM